MRLSVVRHLMRLAVIILFLVIPCLHQAGVDDIRGTLFAFECFGIPFADPLATLQVILTGMIPGWRLILGACLILIISAIFGRVFCSWVCPYGGCSEAVLRLRHHYFPAHPPSVSRTRVPRRSSSFRYRMILLVAGLALVLLTGVPILNAVSLPGWISIELSKVGSLFGVTQADPFTLSDGWGMIFIVLVLISEAVYGKQIWCCLCPQSVLISLAAQGWTATRRRVSLFRYLPEVRLIRDPARCTCGWPDGKTDRPCRDACPVGLFPGKPLPDGIPTVHTVAVSVHDCTLCGRCLVACSQRKKPPSPALRILNVVPVPPPANPESSKKPAVQP